MPVGPVVLVSGVPARVVPVSDVSAVDVFLLAGAVSPVLVWSLLV
jgi:hypothetical protein